MTPSDQDSKADRPVTGPRELAELSMLADGSLAESRRDEVQARIAASPEQSALLERERRAVQAVRGADGIRAPASLRARIAAERNRTTAPRRRRRPAVLAEVLVVVAAVLVLGIVLVTNGSGPQAPTFRQAVALAGRGATAPAPPPATGAAYLLARHVDQISFPNWALLRYPASGERVDRIGGRVARTVYYTPSSGGTVAYTIVGGPALATPRGATATKQNQVWYQSLGLDGRVVVTWRRDGHTCIISATNVPASELRHLAAWRPAV
jgi:anti-sigma factor RsiW